MPAQIKPRPDCNHIVDMHLGCGGTLCFTASPTGGLIEYKDDRGRTYTLRRAFHPDQMTVIWNPDDGPLVDVIRRHNRLYQQREQRWLKRTS